MRFIAVALLSIVSFSVMAADYQCFSYDTHQQINVFTDSGVIIFKDRFGNELNEIRDADKTSHYLETIPVTNQLQFMINDNVVLVIEVQNDLIIAAYGRDKSYHCRVQ